MVKRILKSNSPLLKGYEKIKILGDSYLLANGILIKENNVIWKKKWSHSYLKGYYLSDINVLITDKLSMPGPITTSVGICAIDLSTGNYLWRYWYRFSFWERLMYSSPKKNIRLENLSKASFSNGFLHTENYSINIITGKYKTLDVYRNNEEINDNSQLLKKLDDVEFEDINLGVRFSIKNELYKLEFVDSKLVLNGTETSGDNFPMTVDVIDIYKSPYFRKGILIYLKSEDSKYFLYHIRIDEK